MSAKIFTSILPTLQEISIQELESVYKELGCYLECRKGLDKYNRLLSVSSPERPYAPRVRGTFVRYKDVISYHDAKKLMLREGIKNTIDFKAWVHARKRPTNFPGTPEKAYKGIWTGWTNFLDPNHKI